MTIVEVGLRDGLQNEAKTLTTSEKIELARALLAAGVRRLEATSFVRPEWIPQLSDAEEFVAELRADLERTGASASALCPNERGLERALKSGIKEVAVFMSSSETHNLKNTNKSIADSLELFAKMIPQAKQAGLRVRGYVSTVWGCPYEGPVDPARGIAIATSLVAMGAYQVSLGDTIGVATPKVVADVTRDALKALTPDQLALHFHDTRGTAIANALAGVLAGATTLDASIGGLGGCPYAPGASGNAATEDLAYMLEGMGISTGLSLSKLIEAAKLAARLVDRPLSGKLLQAGLPNSFQK